MKTPCIPNSGWRGIPLVCLAIAGLCITLFAAGAATSRSPAQRDRTHGRVSSLRFTADGKHLITAGENVGKGDVKVWSLANGSLLSTRSFSEGQVLLLPSGLILLETSKGVTIENPLNRETLAFFDPPAGNGSSIGFVAQSNLLVRIVDRTKIQVWDLKRGMRQSIHRFARTPSWELSPECSRALVWVPQTPGVQLLDFLSGAAEEIATDPALTWIDGMKFSSDGSQLAVGGSFGKFDPNQAPQRALVVINPLERKTNVFIHPPVESKWPVRPMEFSTDGQRLLTGAARGLMGFVLYDLARSKRAATVWHKNQFAAASPDLSILVTYAEGPYNLVLWDATNGAGPSDLSRPQSYGISPIIHHMKFSPDGVMLAVATINRVDIWDVPARRLKFRLVDPAVP